MASTLSAVEGRDGQTTDLRSSLEAHDRTFSKLLSLIPAQYYIVDTPEEADSKWMKNKKKRSSEEVAQTKKKAKLEKFDPANQKTVLDIQAERAATSTATTGSAGPSTAPKSTSEVEDAAGTTAPLVPLQPSASIATLRQKLQDKIDSLRKKRREDPVGSTSQASNVNDQDGDDGDNDDDDDAPSIAASRDEMMEERRRRRGEVRDNRRRRRKEERRAEKEAASSGKDKNKAKKASAAESSGKEGPGQKSTEFTTKPGKTSLLVDPKMAYTSGKAPAVSTTVEENVSFPSIALPSSHSHKSATHVKSISNPTQALEHLQKRAAKLADLPEEKRKQIEEKERWAKALERAEGVKVKDDETKLKKAAKRIEKQKEKSGKEWSDRKVAAQKAEAIKAKKRNDNIAARSEARKNKKLGLKPKGDREKGKKARPGFEGGRPGGSKKKQK